MCSHCGSLKTNYHIRTKKHIQKLINMMEKRKKISEKVYGCFIYDPNLWDDTAVHSVR